MTRPRLVISALTWADWLRLAAVLSLAFFIAFLLLQFAASALRLADRISFLGDPGSPANIAVAAAAGSLGLLLMIIAAAAALRLFFACRKLLRR